MTRQEILATAELCVMKDRNATHGNPEDNFGDIARLWSVFKGVEFTAADVAVMTLLIKVARIRQSPEHVDHWIDIAGYAACGGEIATEPGKGPAMTTESAGVAIGHAIQVATKAGGHLIREHCRRAVRDVFDTRITRAHFNCQTEVEAALREARDAVMKDLARE